MNIELDKDSLQRQSETFKQVADTVRDTFNMIQEALGSPLRIDKPKDRYVCKMCGEPPTSNGDGSSMDMDYCTECESHTEFVLESELEEENEDDEKLADQEHKWEADNDR